MHQRCSVFAAAEGANASRPMMVLRPVAASTNEYELIIYGDIGDSWWGESVTAKSVVEQLNALDASVTQINVRINSYGGSVKDGMAIYNALRRHSARKVVTVDGVAMSSASLIAMAGDNVCVHEVSILMIHAPWGLAQGNANDMRIMAEELDIYAEAMANAYAAKSKKAKSDVLAILKDGANHFYTGQQAVDEGFADTLIPAVQEEDDEAAAARANAVASGLGLSRFLSGATPAVAAQATAAARRAFLSAPNPGASSAPQATPIEDNSMFRHSHHKFNEPAGKDGGGAGGPAVVSDDSTRARAEGERAGRESTLAALRERNARILAALKPHIERGVPAILALRDEALADPTMTLETVQAKALTLLGASGAPITGASAGAHAVAGPDQVDKERDAAANYLLSRVNARGADGKQVVVDGANPFRGFTLSELAEHRVRAAGVNTARMTRRDIVAHAMSPQVMAAAGHTTSDFPILLENALNKLLIAAYTGAPTTWQRFCRTGDLNDFRPHGRYRIGTFSDLKEVNEAGNYEQGTISDAEKESITGKRKGRLLLITREMVVNDDMQAIADVTNGIGGVAARTVDKDVFALLALNSGNGPTMGDGNPLFDDAHHNIAGTGGAPGVATFDAARVQMAQQTDPSGNDYLDLRPAIWLGPVGLGGAARVTNNSQYDPDAASKLQRPNIVNGLFADIVDTPRLSGTAWYALANPSIEPVFEVGFVGGQQTPMIDQEKDFDSDGLKFKVVLEYGVAAIGWRGIVKNAGQ